MNYIFIHRLGQLPISWDKTISYFPNDIKIFCPHLSELVNSQKLHMINCIKHLKLNAVLKNPHCICAVFLLELFWRRNIFNYPQNVNSLIMIAPQ